MEQNERILEKERVGNLSLRQGGIFKRLKETSVKIRFLWKNNETETDSKRGNDHLEALL
jgi:hypothetical protein